MTIVAKIQALIAKLWFTFTYVNGFWRSKQNSKFVDVSFLPESSIASVINDTNSTRRPHGIASRITERDLVGDLSILRCKFACGGSSNRLSIICEVD
jgi:hypothetical protein